MEETVKPRRRRRTMILSLTALVVVVAAVGLGLGFRKAGGNGPEKKKDKDDESSSPPAPVELSKVERGSIATFLETTATLEPRNSAMLVARRQGQVMRLLVEEGDRVAAGQVLAQIDDREAQLAVQRNELEAEVAKREVQRGKQLSDQGYLTPKQLDDLEVALRNATVALEQARLDLAHTKIVAPFAGRVVQRLVNLGETVTVGRECFQIMDFDPILARLYFPERELPRVAIGQDAVISLDAQPGSEFHARVSLVNPVVDRDNGTFKVTLEIDNPKGLLRPGAFARIEVKTGHFDDALLVPRRGLLTEDGEDFMFVARGDSAVRIPVKVGAIEGEIAQILDGLDMGDSVVTVGQGGLKSGSKIKGVQL